MSVMMGLRLQMHAPHLGKAVDVCVRVRACVCPIRNSPTGMQKTLRYDREIDITVVMTLDM